MKSNRDAKFAIGRPSDNLNLRVVNYMPFRAKCMNNLKQQLGISNMQQQILPIATSKDKAVDELGLGLGLGLCMKKQLVMLARGEKLPMAYSLSFSPLPSTQWYVLKAGPLISLNKRANVIVPNLPLQWCPDAVISKSRTDHNCTCIEDSA